MNHPPAQTFHVSLQTFAKNEDLKIFNPNNISPPPGLVKNVSGGDMLELITFMS